MHQRLVPILRITVVLVGLAGLVLSIIQLGFLVTAWAGNPVVGMDIEPQRIPTRMLRVLAWGVGFAVLSLVVAWRVGHRGEVLMAGLFLAVYAVWAGVGGNVLFRGESWIGPVMVLLDGLTHAIGIRFTQLFPRPVTAAEVAQLGRGRFRKLVSPVLGALTRPRFFWPFAFVFEATGRMIGTSGSYYAHLLIWLTLATVYLYASYRHGSQEDRRRIFWIMEGVVVFLAIELLWVAELSLQALGVISLDLAFWSRWQSVVEAWASLTCFALAIFYSGAFDSGLILRRTTVLSVTGALAVIIFITLETTVGEILTDMLGLNTRVGDIAIGVVAALAFRPLMDRIDRRVLKLTSDSP